MLKSTQGNLKVEPHGSEKDAFTGWQAPEFEERPGKSKEGFSNFLWLRNGVALTVRFMQRKQIGEVKDTLPARLEIETMKRRTSNETYDGHTEQNCRVSIFRVEAFFTLIAQSKRTTSSTVSECPERTSQPRSTSLAPAVLAHLLPS